MTPPTPHHSSWLSLLLLTVQDCIGVGWLFAQAESTGIPDMKMLDGHKIPAFGLGVYRVPPGPDGYNAVKWALELGYRMVDTAQVYKNEEDVGQAIRDSGIPRANIWVQSKLRSDRNVHGYDEALKSVRDSVERMGLGYLDCFLDHSPFGGKIVETWDAFLALQKEGLLRSIGVSNYDVRHIQALEDHGRPLPVINQIEMHPLIYGERKELIEYCQNKGIIVQAYGSVFFGKTDKLSDPIVTNIMEAHPGKTAAQVLLRWGLQKGFQLIPKSVRRHRLEENMKIFDFELSDAEMEALDHMEGSLNAYWNPVRDAGVDIGNPDRHLHASKSEL